MKTYTQHRLTPAMLKQLSQYGNQRRDTPSGATAQALVKRGLAYRPFDQDRPRFSCGPGMAREIVAQARKEGW